MAASRPGKDKQKKFTWQIIAAKPPDRKPHQVLIFHNHEAEANWRHHHVLSDPTSRWISAFNWTMTYHPQSDFYVPYGITRRRRIPSFRNYTAILGEKTKMVAWIVSHCGTQSKRLEYVRKLQEYIPVDIYGKCGTLRCPRANDDECFQMINKTYKFYLSFENALCADYMTEKVFRYFAANTITVARASNEFYAHAPSEIFLNTADFSSPKALADRMWYLANHDEAYIEMLREKDKYMILYEDYPIRLTNGRIKFMAYRYEAPAFCELCHRLWNMDKYGNSWVPDIRKWLMEQQCQNPQDL